MGSYFHHIFTISLSYKIKLAQPLDIYIIIFVGAWRSLVAHYNGVVGVGGSNPLAPTKI